MNIPKHDLRKVEPTHRKWTFQDTVIVFWEANKTMIGLLVIIICISILLGMMGYAAATRIHFLSTEANVYEHLNQVVL